MKALIKNNMVVDVSKEEFPVHPSFIWMDAPEDCHAGWILFDGVLMRPKPIDIEKISDFSIIEKKIEAMWDFIARNDATKLEQIKNDSI